MRRPAGRSHGRRPVEHARDRPDEQVVVDLVAHGDADPVVVGAHDEALPQEPVAEVASVLERHEEKVRVRDERRQAEAPQGAAQPLSLLDHGPHVGRRGERRDRERRREGRDGSRRLPCVQLRRDRARGEGIADSRTCQPEGLGERPQHDDAVVEERDRSLAAVLEVRLVADERPRLG